VSLTNSLDTLGGGRPVFSIRRALHGLGVVIPAYLRSGQWGTINPLPVLTYMDDSLRTLPPLSREHCYRKPRRSDRQRVRFCSASTLAIQAGPGSYCGHQRNNVGRAGHQLRRSAQVRHDRIRHA
jgi:hypothetical protein